MQNFRFSTADVKFHQICTLISSFSAKKVQKIYVSWPWRLMNNLKKNWLVVPRMTKIWLFLTRVFKSFTNLRFDWFLLCKVFNVWPKKVQRIYLSWQWLAVWKITWRVWQIVTRALESAKIGILWHPFVQGRKCMSLQFTVELCVMTMKNDTKVEKELICRFKIDRGILTNIDLITRKSPKFAL